MTDYGYQEVRTTLGSCPEINEMERELKALISVFATRYPTGNTHEFGLDILKAVGCTAQNLMEVLGVPELSIDDGAENFAMKRTASTESTERH
jgi:hypothetical protein